MNVFATATSLALLIALPTLAQPTPDMAGMKGMDHAAVASGPHAMGVVKKIDARAGPVTLQHGPIAALNWPAMTMTLNCHGISARISGRVLP